MHERVKDDERGGILASMNFPSFPGFAARLFATDDTDFVVSGAGLQRLAHRRVVRRLPGPLHPHGAARHLGRRTVRRRGPPRRRQGVHSPTSTENPAVLAASFHDEYWNPLWKALCDTDTVLSVHIGSSGRLTIPAVDSPDVMPGRSSNR
ncbi:hypothetical protein ACU686_28050 [Yinghuangia aomiensis]